jgi:hypothetical protein
MRFVRESFIAALALSLTVLATGCPDADTIEEPSECAAWSLERNSFMPAERTSATNTSGMLVMSSRGGDICSSEQDPCEDIKLFQQPLSGDFEVTVVVDGVDGAEAFEGVDLFLAPEGADFGNNVAKVSIFGGATGVLPNLSMSDEIEQEAWGVDTTRVILRAKRVGQKVTLSGDVGGEHFERADDVSLRDRLVVGLGLSGGSETRTVTARVASFTVTGGGGAVHSDGFECE